MTPLLPEYDARPPVLCWGSMDGGLDPIAPHPEPGRTSLSELQTVISFIQGDPSFRKDADPFSVVGEGEYAPSDLLDLF